jgi:hypothetical protein
MTVPDPTPIEHLSYEVAALQRQQRALVEGVAGLRRSVEHHDSRLDDLSRLTSVLGVLVQGDAALGVVGLTERLKRLEAGQERMDDGIERLASIGKGILLGLAITGAASLPRLAALAADLIKVFQ